MKNIKIYTPEEISKITEGWDIHLEGGFYLPNVGQILYKLATDGSVLLLRTNMRGNVVDYSDGHSLLLPLGISTKDLIYECALSTWENTEEYRYNSRTEWVAAALSNLPESQTPLFIRENPETDGFNYVSKNIEFFGISFATWNSLTNKWQPLEHRDFYDVVIKCIHEYSFTIGLSTEDVELVNRIITDCN